MITRIGMAPRLRSATIGQFQDHWRTSHADAAGQIPGVRRYVQNHAVLSGGAMILPYPGFDACSELDFDSVESMDEGFSSDVYLRAVQADEKAFVDKTRFSLVVAERETLIEGPDMEGVKLITLLRVHPAADESQLISTLRGPRAEAVRKQRPSRHDLLWPISSAHSGDRTPTAAEAVEVIWFDDLAAALVFIESDAGWPLAGKALGLAELIARPLQVV